MQEIGSVLRFLFKGYLENRDPRIIELLAPLWPRVVGKAVAVHSRPVSFESGSLTVATSDPNWGKELRALSEQIRVEVNSFWGKALVKRVLIVQRKDQSKAKSGEPAAEFEPARGTAKLASPPPAFSLPDGDSRLDPEMQAILSRSYAKYFARACRTPI